VEKKIIESDDEDENIENNDVQIIISIDGIVKAYSPSTHLFGFPVGVDNPLWERKLPSPAIPCKTISERIQRSQMMEIPSPSSETTLNNFFVDPLMMILRNSTTFLIPIPYYTDYGFYFYFFFLKKKYIGNIMSCCYSGGWFPEKDINSSTGNDEYTTFMCFPVTTCHKFSLIYSSTSTPSGFLPPTQNISDAKPTQTDQIHNHLPPEYVNSVQNSSKSNSTKIQRNESNNKNVKKNINDNLLNLPSILVRTSPFPVTDLERVVAYNLPSFFDKYSEQPIDDSQKTEVKMDNKTEKQDNNKNINITGKPSEGGFVITDDPGLVQYHFTNHPLLPLLPGTNQEETVRQYRSYYRRLYEYQQQQGSIMEFRNSQLLIDLKTSKLPKESELSDVQIISIVNY
jgi:hypothetical protein